MVDSSSKNLTPVFTNADKAEDLNAFAKATTSVPTSVHGSLVSDFDESPKNLLENADYLTSVFPNADKAEDLTSVFPNADKAEDLTSVFKNADKMEDLTSVFTNADKAEDLTAFANAVPTSVTGSLVSDFDESPKNLLENADDLTSVFTNADKEEDLKGNKINAPGTVKKESD